MDTRQMIVKVRELGLTIKALSRISNINADTLYNYNCGRSNLSKEKQQRLRDTINRFNYAYYYEYGEIGNYMEEEK